jgi:succinate dehydrogenase/fumarate reductase flavoprotein subunit
VVVFTAFGPRIDPAARVLDRAGRPIPGLYAAGEAGASVFGDVYVPRGVSIANCAVFGRIAGTNAAREALQISGG